MEEVGYTNSPEESKIRTEFELRWLGVSIDLPVEGTE
jgi:hypothetical protein